MSTTESKPYTHMNIEDYAPYNTISVDLHGPEPFIPLVCRCNRYIVDNICICTNSTKNEWSKEHPELYEAEQTEHRRMICIWHLWDAQKQDAKTMLYRRKKAIVLDFKRLRDKESSIGCYDCEYYEELDYCCCRECENCGDKYCNGCGFHREDYC